MRLDKNLLPNYESSGGNYSKNQRYYKGGEPTEHYQKYKVVKGVVKGAMVRQRASKESGVLGYITKGKIIKTDRQDVDSSGITWVRIGPYQEEDGFNEGLVEGWTKVKTSKGVPQLELVAYAATDDELASQEKNLATQAVVDDLAAEATTDLSVIQATQLSEEDKAVKVTLLAEQQEAKRLMSEGVETNINASNIDHEQNLWFGTTNGLFLFNGESTKNHKKIGPAFRFLDIQLFYETVLLQIDMSA